MDFLLPIPSNWQWMYRVRLQIAFGHVGHVFSPVDKHVIPGLVLRGTRPRHDLVPFIGALKRGVDIEDDTSIVIHLVMDELAYEEFGDVLHGTSIAESN